LSISAWLVRRKEVIGGYALIQTPSRKDAINLATAFMEIHRRHWPEFECTCELRPIDGEDESSAAATSAAAPQASS
jgi:hypothetical protein